MNGSTDGTGPSADDTRRIRAALGEARTSLEKQEPAAAVRALRGLPDSLLIDHRDLWEETTRVVEAAAGEMGFGDLELSARAARESPEDAHVLYRYGYDCGERGASFLAVPALLTALGKEPRIDAIRMELACALSAEERYVDSVRILAGSDAMDLWAGRYLLVLNCLLAGDVNGARQWHTKLKDPQDEAQERQLARLTGMLSRARLLQGTEELHTLAAAPSGPSDTLGRGDLRGWHFTLNGSLLLRLSPFGPDEGMAGRFAYYQETLSGCRLVLDRLGASVTAAGRMPSSVALLPERSSRILALAAAGLWGLPAVEWSPDLTGVLVAAYDLRRLDVSVLRGLRESSEQVLFEHATCWTDPPVIAPDVSGVLHQISVAPWEPGLRVSPDGESTVTTPADERPEEAVAADLLAAPTGREDLAVGDTEEDLLAYAARVRSLWALGTGGRDRVWSPGPVRSNRFV